MKKHLLGALCVLAATFAGTAQAGIITHEDDAANAFRTFRGSGSAPVGRLTVAAQETISRFGIELDLNGDGDLTFLIFDSGNGNLLYQSAAKAFADTGAGYKFSDVFSFTFNPGTTYGLTAISSTGGSYYVDFAGNTIGNFNFLTGNQNVVGTSLALGNNCCDVGTALDTAVPNNSVPEPSSIALMGLGLAAVAARRRKQSK